MIAIISPSKTQDFVMVKSKNSTIPQQLKYSQQLINILKTKNINEITKLMKISEKLGILNLQRFKNFKLPFNQNNAKAALFAFKGDVYNGIDVNSFNDKDIEFANKSVRILSGLYGILKPLDLIQPYRLEMSTKLAIGKHKNLYQFWGHKLSSQLNADKEIIINLASNEYFKAIDKQYLNAKIINIVFKENKNNSYKIIGIYAKRARGLMINYMVKNKIKKPLDLQKFNLDKYSFNKMLSSESSWIFTR